jgi:hypothetical protein
MTSLWSRFESSPCTLPLLLLTYAPTLLLIPTVGLELAEHLLFRNTILFLLAWGTLLSYAVPASCAGTWLVRLLVPERISARVRRVVIVSAVLAWLPHYHAVACWCLLAGIQQDGLVP